MVVRFPSRKAVGNSLILLAGLLGLAFLFWSFSGLNSYELSRREVLLRRVGHEMLLKAGDSTSRVLPVRKLEENSYQILFERELSFEPDSLVALSRDVLGPLGEDYTVNVVAGGGLDVMYAFAISGSAKDDLVACSGRIQPVARYSLLVKFKPGGLTEREKGYLMGSLPIFALVGFLAVRRSGPKVQAQKMGDLLFDERGRVLIYKGQSVELTGTESRILKIFAASPNEVVERERLQKEIWEGVIVSRSLDMFISKLRKKLEIDTRVRIEVVRGKGYKLVVD